MQQMQKVPADRIIVRLDLDALAVDGKVIPVQQHRTERGHQPIGDVLRTSGVVVILFRQRATERGNRGTQHVHRMR